MRDAERQTKSRLETAIDGLPQNGKNLGHARVGSYELTIVEVDRAATTVVIPYPGPMSLRMHLRIREVDPGRVPRVRARRPRPVFHERPKVLVVGFPHEGDACPLGRGRGTRAHLVVPEARVELRRFAARCFELALATRRPGNLVDGGTVSRYGLQRAGIDDVRSGRQP